MKSWDGAARRAVAVVGAFVVVWLPPSVAMIVYGWREWTLLSCIAFCKTACRLEVWVARGPEKSVQGGRSSVLRGGRLGVWVFQCGAMLRSWDWGVRDHVATVYMDVISWRWS